MALFQNERGSYCIGSGGVWVPGVYDSERAARYAFRFSDTDLRQLQNEVNQKEPNPEKRVISFSMLQELRKRNNHVSTKETSTTTRR